MIVSGWFDGTAPTLDAPAGTFGASVATRTDADSDGTLVAEVPAAKRRDGRDEKQHEREPHDRVPASHPSPTIACPSQPHAVGIKPFHTQLVHAAT